MAGDERRWRREGTRRYLRVDRFGLLFYAHHRGRRTLPIAIFEVVPRLIVAGRVKLRVVPVFRHGLPLGDADAFIMARHLGCDTLTLF